MSNRNSLLPSINTWSNPVFKGNGHFTGNLLVDGDITVGDDLEVTGDIEANDLVLPASNAYNIRTMSIFIADIVSATGEIAVQVAGIAGTIISMHVVANAATTVGPAIFTLSKISGGVTTLIGNGAISVLTTDPAFTGYNNIVSAPNTLISTDILKVVISGTNTQAGTATVTLRVQVSSL